MSLISLSRGSLKSQIVRNLIGERTIDIFADLAIPETEEEDEGGNFLTRWAAGLVTRLPGFILNIVGRAVGWFLRNVWSIIVESTFTIVNFDWNQTDAALQSQINANNVAIAAALGETLGSGSVYLASIVLASGAALKFPVLGGKVALELAEEGGEEVRSQVVNLLSASRNALARNAVLGTMLTARRLRLFGLAPITSQREPWSIAGQIEERIEGISNELLRAFVENFVEGAADAIIEVGYVISYAIDDYYASSRLANERLLGEQRAVKLYPDRTNEEEFVVLRGPQELVKQNIQTALTTQTWVRNRDVGNIYGTPTDTYQQSVKFRPQIKLWFVEDYEDVEEGYDPIRAEISFRLTNETSGSITPQDALNLANKVKSQFADGGGFRFHKGRLKVSYKNAEQGYNLLLAVVSEAEGRRVISNVLDIQGHTFDGEFMTVSNLVEAPPIVPDRELIFGQTRRLPRRRPVGWVRFLWAELHVYGLPNPVTLVDRTRRRRSPLVQV